MRRTLFIAVPLILGVTSCTGFTQGDCLTIFQVYDFHFLVGQVFAHRLNTSLHAVIASSEMGER